MKDNHTGDVRFGDAPMTEFGAAPSSASATFQQHAQPAASMGGFQQQTQPVNMGGFQYEARPNDQGFHFN